jgi:hypothetical protein
MVHRLRRALLVAGALLLAGVIAVAVVRAVHDDDPAAPLAVTWGGGEGDPSCSYDEALETVDAKLTIDGGARGKHEVTVTVTAYADENTSRPVGSSSRTVPVEGTVHLRLVVTIPVQKPPHVDDDGIAACRLSVES